MKMLVNPRVIALIIGLLVALFALRGYPEVQPNPVVLVLVGIGSWLFWGWIASLGVSLVQWRRSETMLMGRLRRIYWQASPFNVAKLAAKIVGVAIPFVAYSGQEGWSALTNPEHWALVPVTLGVCLTIVTVPLWRALKYGAKRVKGTAP